MDDDEYRKAIPIFVANQVSIMADLAALKDFIAEGAAGYNPGITKEKVLEVIAARARRTRDELLRHTADDFPAWASAIKKHLEQLDRQAKKDGQSPLDEAGGE